MPPNMTRYQWTVLLAAWLGWGFDIFDSLLFNYVAPTCVPVLLHLPLGSPAAASATLRWTGILTSLLLVGWATGGIVFGRVAGFQCRQRMGNGARRDFDGGFLCGGHLFELGAHCRETRFKRCEQRDARAGGYGFFHHGFVRLQHRNFYRRARGFDGRPERRAGEENGIGAAVFAVTRQRAETLNHFLLEASGSGEVARQRIVEQVADLGLRPQALEGVADRVDGDGGRVNEGDAGIFHGRGQGRPLDGRVANRISESEYC